MIWLTWRQFRIQAWVALVALVVLAAALLATAPGLADLSRSTGLDTCGADCGAAARDFLAQFRTTAGGRLYWVAMGVMFLVPAVIGVFWGAPLIARELETGTHRLAWTQGVTRGRWLAVKVVGVGLAAVATVGLFSLAVTWWADPIDTAFVNRLFPEVFAGRGIAPVGYAAFAFALGVAVGMLVRRTVPAMAITLAVVAAVQLAMPLLIRPHLLPPVHVTAPLDISALKSFHLDPENNMRVIAEVPEAGAWEVSNRTITPSGDLFIGPADPRFCGHGTSPRICTEWVDGLQLRQDVRYHPAGRFWPLQWLETGIFLVLAGLLAGFCFWWVRHRLN